MKDDYFVNMSCCWDMIFIRAVDREYLLDKGGRLHKVVRGEEVIEKNLGSKFVLKSGLGFDNIYKNVRVLERDEALALNESFHKDLKKVLSSINSGVGVEIIGNEESAVSFIKMAMAFDISKLDVESKKFKKIYSSIDIFPSDLINPLMIQVVRGCSYNKCSFCEFYSGVKFYEKSIDEVSSHILEVEEFLGHSLLNYRDIFLCDGNALMIEQKKLCTVLELIKDHFLDSEKYSFDGIVSFIDAFTGGSKSVADFIALKERGLKKVYVGLESGSDIILKYVKKCNEVKDVVELVRNLKSAKIDVGIMVISGLGGDKYYEEHVKRTVEVINSMNLSTYDSINISHLVVGENSQYLKDSKKDEIMPLSYDEEEEQIQKMINGFKFKKTLPRIRGYEIKHIRY